MYRATIIENSLSDKGLLDELIIEKTWQADDWVLHDVLVREDQIHKLSQYLAHGPWYIHLWEVGKDDIVVVFKDKTFKIKFSDKSTWIEAITHGKSIGIPDEQLDFVIN